MMRTLLEKLTSIPGPCGYEQKVASWIVEQVQDEAVDVKIDGIGNVWATLKGNKDGPKVVVTAHMDEVGFIVKKIEANGLLRFEKLGGHDDRILLAQPVDVHTKSETLHGVIGTMSAHYVKFDDAKRVRSHRELYIDIGARSEQEALDMGVRIGTIVTWHTSLQALGNGTTNRLYGKALDDRAGCAVLLELFRRLKGQNFHGEVLFLWTVQEEVGLRGAHTAARSLQADLAIAIDTTAASDTPETTMDGTLTLGGGTGIKVLDFSLIANPGVKDRLVDLAEEHHIPYQLEVFPGIGTDGGAVAFSEHGIPTGVLSIPSRNAHAPVEVIDEGDLEATVNLLEIFVHSSNTMFK